MSCIGSFGRSPFENAICLNGITFKVTCPRLKTGFQPTHQHFEPTATAGQVDRLVRPCLYLVAKYFPLQDPDEATRLDCKQQILEFGRLTDQFLFLRRTIQRCVRTSRQYQPGSSHPRNTVVGRGSISASCMNAKLEGELSFMIFTYTTGPSSLP